MPVYTSYISQGLETLGQLACINIGTAASTFWSIVTFLWSPYWLFLLLGFVVWVIWELVTRNRGIHYDSKNGFSPAFNIIIGSGVYALLQGGVYLVIRLLFGDGPYCTVWPYPFHIAVFFLTGWFLNAIGFWVYWKLPRF